VEVAHVAVACACTEWVKLLLADLDDRCSTEEEAARRLQAYRALSHLLLDIKTREYSVGVHMLVLAALLRVVHTQPITT
jgi:hypothetical protein